MNEKQKVLTIIPARGGSKRIPGKNIKDFCGKPLIAYAIGQAKSVVFSSRLVVDTDSEEIASIARKYGAEVPRLRPEELAQDKSKVVDSILFLLKKLKETENYTPEYVMILQTTSPLREMKDIENCWNLMQSSDATTVLTVCPTHPRFYNMDDDNNIILVNGNEGQSTNVQEWRPGYILNGCFVYIVRTEDLIREKRIITDNTKAIICPKWRSVDLDSPEDWVIAENLFKNKDKILSELSLFKQI